MDNKEDKQGSWMMWAMMICCALPLFAILLFGLGGKALGGSSWVIFGGVAVMLLAHFFMMRGHGHSNEEHNKQSVDGEEDKNKKDKNHSSHGSCH